MAPRRGGGGGGSSGGVSACPGAFSSIEAQVYFAQEVLFLTVYLGISIALCIFRKRSGDGKKLLGIPFILSVLFFVVYYACLMISDILLECGTTEIEDYYSWRIATIIFFNVAEWLLLVVVVFTLNTMLREQLGRTTTIIKGLLLAPIGVMGAITCAIISIGCYLQWLVTERGSYTYTYYSYYELAISLTKLRLAYLVLYLVIVLASGGFALKSIMALRSRRNPTGDLIGWVVALTISMVLWILLLIIFAAWTLQGELTEFETTAALGYIADFAQALSFIFIICIAKHVGWNRSTSADPMTGYAPQQHQYAHNADHYNYGQQPVYATPKP